MQPEFTEFHGPIHDFTNLKQEFQQRISEINKNIIKIRSSNKISKNYKKLFMKKDYQIEL